MWSSFFEIIMALSTVTLFFVLYLVFTQIRERKAMKKVFDKIFSDLDEKKARSEERRKKLLDEIK